MAQGQLIRCLWSLRPLASQLAVQEARKIQCGRLALTTGSCIQRTFSTTAPTRVSFHVQDEEDFEERVVKSKTPVIVDFHAKWCGPCKILGPRLEAAVAAQEGKVVLAKVDIDDNQDLAIEHGVQAVPTVVSFKDGSVSDKFVGLKDDDQLDTFIAKLL